jgi:hypothetical protein
LSNLPFSWPPVDARPSITDIVAISYKRLGRAVAEARTIRMALLCLGLFATCPINIRFGIDKAFEVGQSVSQIALTLLLVGFPELIG